VKSDLRTVVFCWLVDRSGVEDVADRSLEQIRKDRADAIPHRWPASLITGAIARGVRIADRTLPLPDAPLRARVYTPRAAGPLPLVVYFHGGGWVTGNVQSYDAVCSQIADRVGAVVVSVDYRLAPEHRMPVAAEDAYAATVWLAANAAAVGADGSRLAVAGDSAGGNLAAVVSILARDRGGPSIAHQVLIYPGTDGTLSSPSLQEHADGPILNLANVRAYRSLYLGPDGDETDVRFSPLTAPDHTNLPPALIQTAQLDPIRDDGARYAEALSQAGNLVRYTEYVGAPHGYLSIPGAVRGSRQALAEIVHELRTHLAVTVQPHPLSRHAATE
jgi:acetyl esterase/lipase